jgi:Asp-tRNA(Asn)/Glu-tRNA(Gln) amidotransferase C subunit
MIEAILLAAAQPDAPAGPDCAYDLDAMLALDRQAFDQEIPDGGWRGLSREGCYEEAAELIRSWRHEKRDHASILYWHEGQMRAFAGQTEEAIGLFERTYTAPEEDRDFGWNFYVSGTIAFLRNDREGLTQAIEGLAKIPEPADNTFTRPDGTVVKMGWPPNMNVLKNFEMCWGRSYKETYGSSSCLPEEG